MSTKRIETNNSKNQSKQGVSPCPGHTRVMAIRIIKRGTIECDDCKKLLASIRMSEQLLKVFLEEQRFTDIFCNTCTEKRDAEDEKK